MVINNKRKPFQIPKLTEDYPIYARVLAQHFKDVPELPDFYNDNFLYILSDFGGEHKGANFKTYSFLICSKDKNIVFDVESKALREKYGLNDPFKEFSFKDLKYGAIKKALPSFLQLADKYIHGVLFTISIENTLETVFDTNKKNAYTKAIQYLQDHDLGMWKGQEAEKLLRVCHPLAMFMSMLSSDNQSFIWICDHDSINVDGKFRDFTHTQKIFCHVLNMYSDVRYKTYGFAKRFNDDSTTTDLLSLTDFSAGVIQEFLQEELLGKQTNPSTEKVALIEWLARKSNFLKKYNFIIRKSNERDSWDVGTLDLSEK